MTDKQLWHLMAFIKACTDKICCAIYFGEHFSPTDEVFDFPEALLQSHKKKIWKENDQ